MNRFTFIVTAGALFLAGCSQPASTQKASAPKVAIERWGFDLKAMDRSIQPGDDFYRYAGDAWMKTAQIPADQGNWGTMVQLGQKAETDTNAIAVELAGSKNAPGSNAQKIADFYSSILDTKTIDELGMKPFQADFDAIAALKTHEEVVALAVRPGFGGSLPIVAFPTPDSKNPDRHIVNVMQAGLALPNRDNYLSKEPSFAAVRAEFKAHINRVLALAKLGDASSAQTILDLETRIAAAQWPIEKLRNKDLTYNLRSREQVLKEYPQFPWEAMLKAAKLDQQKELIVGQPTAIAELAKLFRATPVSVWKDYLKYHYIASLSDLMPTAVNKENFAFYGKTLNGTPAQPERWRVAVSTLNGPNGSGILAEAVGEFYVKKHFAPEAKAEITELVHNLLDTYQDRIRNSEWMSPATREAAIRKAQKVIIKVGYPDKWRDVSKLEIKPRDAFGNYVRTSIFTWEDLIGRLSKPTDRTEWGMAPQTVNTYYSAQFNEIVFPAAILQPPAFDHNADRAVNYGGIGAVIGHEMGHGYDDQGAKSDENGILRSWWQKDDEQRFQVLTKRLAAQYSLSLPCPDSTSTAAPPPVRTSATSAASPLPMRHTGSRSRASPPPSSTASPATSASSSAGRKFGVASIGMSTSGGSPHRMSIRPTRSGSMESSETSMPGTMLSKSSPPTSST